MFAAPRRIALGVVCLVVISAACSKRSSNEAGTTRDSATAAAPKATDSAVASAANLRGTYWKLVSLGDKAVTASPDSQRVAHIVLQPDSKNVAGSGGCNRLFGVYELNGDALRFSGVGSTKMACKDGMGTEAAFLPALLRVTRWKVSGRQLDLSDSTGAVLARFEAR